MTRPAILLFGLACLLMAPLSIATAQETRSERVEFARGQSSAEIAGRLRGRESIDYVLNARGGQRLSVDLSADNASTYFNILPPRGDTAIFIGPSEGNRFSAVLRQSGDYRIQVYLMRNAARRGETTRFTLSVAVRGDGPARPSPEIGGRGSWVVTGLQPGDRLNMRAGPGQRFAVLEELPNGTLLRNLGCEAGGQTEWCKVALGNDEGISGWVNRRFIAEVRTSPAQPPQPAPQPDFADGLAGGPDYWMVTGLSGADTLNMRSAPGAGNPVVGQLANGMVVRNLGCRMAGGGRWCQIATGLDERMTGWVSGRFLVEAGSPAGPGAPVPVQPQRPRPPQEITGLLPCATALGQPTGTCPFRAQRGEPGNAAVWISLPSGRERFIEFRGGRVVATDPGLSFAAERVGDLTLIRIGGERYEIADALPFGG
ncbi:SH3 domain-containing protein [Pannonibacter sp. SL95]|uniref:SH3 domain-containing protein n=1 Tax=Pannonibacter sp. SL95 TaxID=2995153 RepID=UPI0022760434|nr:SH3 domain-containing protein [Pannonibacter sp. SL95]MCY1704675.1 SH3 domain-containing protein [Pannonibacter sp. SL95]